MVELVLLQSESCVSCVSLSHEVKQLVAQDNNLKLTEYSQEDDVNKHIQIYDIEKLPALIVLKDNQKLGQCYGYQPIFILEAWIDSLLEKGKQQNA